MFLERICVQCNQTGAKYKVQYSSLSLEDGRPVTTSELVEGHELLFGLQKKVVM